LLKLGNPGLDLGFYLRYTAGLYLVERQGDTTTFA